MDDTKRNEVNIEQLAEEVLKLSRDTLLVNLRFMNAALSRLKSVATPFVTFATDGKTLAYSPKHLLRCYAKERESCVRNYLHIVLHCVFHHPFVDSSIDQELWNIACDIAVESAITDLNLISTRCNRESAQQTIDWQLKSKVSIFTAEKLYRFFLNAPPTEDEKKHLCELFSVDDHYAWYLPPEINSDSIAQNREKDNENNSDDNDQPKEDSTEKESETDNHNETDTAENLLKRPTQSVADDWDSVSHRTQIGMETHSARFGTEAGMMSQNLRAVNREKYDYTAFLKRFAVLGEAMKINDDEFDYIFYTYGLKLYEKMPLIEPLEYKEVKLIKEFVIAIDTSGSVSGELVQRFIQKTYNILKTTESFFTKINLYIIQCDSQIQAVVKIESQDEFDAYMKTMEIHGLGGTDFRPVFSYVDELVRSGELTRLKGMIYFTDGAGAFPEKKPSYETAIVFVDDDCCSFLVPSWAIKIVMSSDEI